MGYHLRFKLQKWRTDEKKKYWYIRRFDDHRMYYRCSGSEGGRRWCKLAWERGLDVSGMLTGEGLRSCWAELSSFFSSNSTELWRLISVSKEYIGATFRVSLRNESVASGGPDAFMEKFENSRRIGWSKRKGFRAGLIDDDCWISESFNEGIGLDREDDWSDEYERIELSTVEKPSLGAIPTKTQKEQTIHLEKKKTSSRKKKRRRSTSATLKKTSCSSLSSYDAIPRLLCNFNIFNFSRRIKGREKKTGIKKTNLAFSLELFELPLQSLFDSLVWVNH